jgi:plastocyanin
MLPALPRLLRLLPPRSMLWAMLWLYATAATAASGATLTMTLTDQEGNAVDDAVLYVSAVDGKQTATVPMQVNVDQVDEMFVPHVRAITTGSSISFPNSDHIRHHVYSFSEARTFELPLYIGIPAEPLMFDKAGLVTLGCNIHDHMLGYVLVLDTPYFAEVVAGSATIANLPTGQWAIEIWHPRLAQETAIQLTVDATADTVLQQQLELRPERMVRRAPRRGGSRY